MKSPLWNGFYLPKIIKSSSLDTLKSPSLTCNISMNSLTIKIVKLKSKVGSIISVLSSCHNTSSIRNKANSWCYVNQWEQEKSSNKIFLSELQQRSSKTYRNNHFKNKQRNSGVVSITRKHIQKLTCSKYPNLRVKKQAFSLEFINKTFKFQVIELYVCKVHFQKLYFHHNIFYALMRKSSFFTNKIFNKFISILKTWINSGF